MSSPLLEVRKLTLKFRGLTAVHQVDLAVPEGDIFAVIGPNGAGKTSLFNAITGIYEPTSGSVRFADSDLRRPLTRSDLVKWIAYGLGLGLLLFLIVSDLNLMWSAVIKANCTGADCRFDLGAAAADFGGYLRAAPRIEQRTGRYYVTTETGDTPFGSARTRAEAEAKLEALSAVSDLGGATDTVEQRGDLWVILNRERTRVLDEAPSEEKAVQRLKAATKLEATRKAAVKKRFLAGLLGIVLGVAGGWAVWRQTRRTPAQVASRGIARTFQNIRLFQEMSVLENVLVGMDRHLLRREKWWSARRLRELGPVLLLGLLLAAVVCLRRADLLPAMTGVLLLACVAGTAGYMCRIAALGAFSRSALDIEARARSQARGLLKFVGLAGRDAELAKNLAYGDQRRLEIARALATRPRLLLLDEPAAGMNPKETMALMQLIRAIRDQGTTVLLIEHHMRVVMGISDRIAVLEYGSKIAEGRPEEIRADPKVIEAYLGKEEVG